MFITAESGIAGLNSKRVMLTVASSIQSDILAMAPKIIPSKDPSLR
jgi:hypothetical protein